MNYSETISCICGLCKCIYILFTLYCVALHLIIIVKDIFNYSLSLSLSPIFPGRILKMKCVISTSCTTRRMTVVHLPKRTAGTQLLLSFTSLPSLSSHPHRPHTLTTITTHSWAPPPTTTKSKSSFRTPLHHQINNRHHRRHRRRQHQEVKMVNRTRKWIVTCVPVPFHLARFHPNV